MITIEFHGTPAELTEALGHAKQNHLRFVLRYAAIHGRHFNGISSEAAREFHQRLSKKGYMVQLEGGPGFLRDDQWVPSNQRLVIAKYHGEYLTQLEISLEIMARALVEIARWVRP